MPYAERKNQQYYINKQINKRRKCKSEISYQPTWKLEDGNEKIAENSERVIY